MNKQETIVLDAVQDADGVYRVPKVLERVEWKVHYHSFPIDDTVLPEEIIKHIREVMIRDMEKMSRELFRMASS